MYKKILATLGVAVLGLTSGSVGNQIPEANYYEANLPAIVETGVKKAPFKIAPNLTITGAHREVLNVSINDSQVGNTWGSVSTEYVDSDTYFIFSFTLQPGLYFFELTGDNTTMPNVSNISRHTQGGSINFNSNSFISISGSNELKNKLSIPGSEQYDAKSGFFTEFKEKASGFEVAYQIYGAGGQNASLKITKLNTKVDGQKPVINGTTNFVVNINNMLSKEEILSHITAIDDTDGEVPVVIESSTYEPSNRKIGDYQMVVSATDRAHNKITQNIAIKVVDIDKPVISGTTNYTKSYDNPISLDTIKAGLNISDNYDTGIQLKLISDGYTGHEREVGQHTIVFGAEDSSHNKADNISVNIVVEDKKAPIISGAGTINQPTNSILSLEEIKSKISVNDGLDGVITEFDISGYDKYLASYNIVGQYPITITARDKAGNTQTATLTIKTEDKIAPEIWFDDYFIVLEQGQSLSSEQIKQMASKVLGISEASIMSIEGDYDTQTAGVYKMAVRTITGETYQFNLSVNVPAEEVNYTERQLNGWEKFVKFFTILIFNSDEYYHTDSWFSGFTTRWTNTWDIMMDKTLYRELK